MQWLHFKWLWGATVLIWSLQLSIRYMGSSVRLCFTCQFMLNMRYLASSRLHTQCFNFSSVVAKHEQFGFQVFIAPVIMSIKFALVGRETKMLKAHTDSKRKSWSYFCTGSQFVKHFCAHSFCIGEYCLINNDVYWLGFSIESNRSSDFIFIVEIHQVAFDDK